MEEERDGSKGLGSMTAPRPRRVREEWPEALSTERNAGLGVGSRRGPSRIMENWYKAIVQIEGHRSF